MKKYFELKTALDYIELHICDNITQGEIAQAACISVSALQKVFRCTFGYSIKEYIVKRKMTMAAEDVLNGTEGLMEIALRYGYSTLESFSRAFRKVNGVLPSDYRKQGKQTAAFTRLVLNDFGISREAAALVEAAAEEAVEEEEPPQAVRVAAAAAAPATARKLRREIIIMKTLLLF